MDTRERWNGARPHQMTEATPREEPSSIPTDTSPAFVARKDRKQIGLDTNMRGDGEVGEKDNGFRQRSTMAGWSSVSVPGSWNRFNTAPSAHSKIPHQPTVPVLDAISSANFPSAGYLIHPSGMTSIILRPSLLSSQPDLSFQGPRIKAAEGARGFLGVVAEMAQSDKLADLDLERRTSQVFPNESKEAVTVERADRGARYRSTSAGLSAMREILTESKALRGLPTESKATRGFTLDSDISRQEHASPEPGKRAPLDKSVAARVNGQSNDADHKAQPDVVHKIQSILRDMPPIGTGQRLPTKYSLPNPNLALDGSHVERLRRQAKKNRSKGAPSLLSRLEGGQEIAQKIKEQKVEAFASLLARIEGGIEIAQQTRKNKINHGAALLAKLSLEGRPKRSNTDEMDGKPGSGPLEGLSVDLIDLGDDTEDPTPPRAIPCDIASDIMRNLSSLNIMSTDIGVPSKATLIEGSYDEQGMFHRAYLSGQDETTSSNRGYDVPVPDQQIRVDPVTPACPEIGIGLDQKVGILIPGITPGQDSELNDNKQDEVPPAEQKKRVGHRRAGEKASNSKQWLQLGNVLMAPEWLKEYGAMSPALQGKAWYTNACDGHENGVIANVAADFATKWRTKEIFRLQGKLAKQLERDSVQKIPGAWQNAVKGSFGDILS